MATDSNSSISSSNKRYPNLNLKLIMISSTALFVMGLFILGMQVWVLASYSDKYGDGWGSFWGDAYNGTSIANSIACLIFALYFLLLIPRRCPLTLLIGLVLTILGEGLAIAATILSSIETDWLNVNANDASSHPCQYKEVGYPGYPSKLDCTNWLYLEVTIAVLSALCVFFYSLVGYVIWVAILAGPNPQLHHQRPAMTTIKTPAPTVPAASSESPDPYISYNPQYSKHLQQVIVQQKVMEETAVVTSIPRVDMMSQQQQRGGLQIQYNQRFSTQQPGPPPVAPKPMASSSYRF